MLLQEDSSHMALQVQCFAVTPSVLQCNWPNNTHYSTLLLAGNTVVDSITGAVTTDACTSGAFSMASLTTVIPLLLTGLAVVCGLLY